MEGNVKHLLLVSVLLLACISLASAQQGQGYAFFAPGQARVSGESPTFLHFGGGAKYISKSRVGVGAELGIAGPKEDFSNEDVGLFSANAYYTFKDRDPKVEPFLTGGYSRAFGHDSGVNFANFGAGFNYWLKERMGILVEYRHHIGSAEDERVQLWEVRLGVSFK
jgi:hypothetical protein